MDAVIDTIGVGTYPKVLPGAGERGVSHLSPPLASLGRMATDEPAWIPLPACPAPALTPPGERAEREEPLMNQSYRDLVGSILRLAVAHRRADAHERTGGDDSCW